MSVHLSAHQAAARCGVSERTVRRWITRGRLQADKQAGTYRVALEDAAALRGQSADNAADSGRLADGAAAGPVSATADSGHWAPLVRDLQTELLRRTEASTMWQARAEMLGHRLRALEAPTAHQTPTDARETAETPDPPSGSPPRRPRRPRRPSHHSRMGVTPGGGP